jgi:hypothetical protein
LCEQRDGFIEQKPDYPSDYSADRRA